MPFHMYAISYKGLEHLLNLVSVGVLEPPLQIPGANYTSVREDKEYFIPLLPKTNQTLDLYRELELMLARM